MFRSFGEFAGEVAVAVAPAVRRKEPYTSEWVSDGRGGFRRASFAPAFKCSLHSVLVCIIVVQSSMAVNDLHPLREMPRCHLPRCACAIAFSGRKNSKRGNRSIWIRCHRYACSILVYGDSDRAHGSCLEYWCLHPQNETAKTTTLTSYALYSFFMI